MSDDDRNRPAELRHIEDDGVRVMIASGDKKKIPEGGTRTSARREVDDRRRDDAQRRRLEDERSRRP